MGRNTPGYTSNILKKALASKSHVIFTLAVDAALCVYGPVTGTTLHVCPETDFSSLIILATIVFSMVKITSGFKIFVRN